GQETRVHHPHSSPRYARTSVCSAPGIIFRWPRASATHSRSAAGHTQDGPRLARVAPRRVWRMGTPQTGQADVVIAHSPFVHRDSGTPSAANLCRSRAPATGVTQVFVAVGIAVLDEGHGVVGGHSRLRSLPVAASTASTGRPTSRLSQENKAPSGR